MTQRRTYVSFLIAAAIIWLSACGATPPSTDTPSDGGPTAFEPNVIAGILTDGAGSPLAGQQVSVAAMPATASVTTLTAEAQRASVALTDAAGQFKVPVTVEGTYGIGSVGDTTGAFGTVVVERGSDGPLRQTSAVTLSTAPLGAIAGTVDGPGAGVFVFALGTSFSAVTDATGAFSISRVPAGTYQVVAGTPGNVTAPQAVTVVAGEVATIASPIACGPRVTGVDPEGFVTPAYSVTSGTLPLVFTISGSGFGSSQGLSVLRYAGVNVDAAITSWSDTAVQVDSRRLEEAHYDTARARLGLDTPADAFRFEVITAAGSSTSLPVGIAATVLWRGLSESEAANEAQVWVSMETVWEYEVPDVTYSVLVTNGTAISSSDGTAISTVTTAPVSDDSYDDYGRPIGAVFDVRLDDLLPAVVTLVPSGDPLFTAVEPRSTAVAGTFEFIADEATFSDGMLTVTGSLVAWDGSPMPDDGGFAISLDPWRPEIDDLALAIEPDGSFTATGSVPSWVASHWEIDFWLVYRGLELGWYIAEVTE